MFQNSIILFKIISVIVAILFPVTNGQTIKFVVVSESAQQELNNKFSEGLKTVQDSNPGAIFEMETINFTRKFSEDAYTELCSILQKDNFVAIIDLAWGGWIKGRKTAAQIGIPYIRVETANHLFVRAADDYLKFQNAIDAAIIFPNKKKLDQSLYYIIGNSYLRIIGAQMGDPNALDRLKKMRPRPSNYVAWGNTDFLKKLYQKAKNEDMIKRDSKWTLVFEDFKSDYQSNIIRQNLMDLANIIEMSPKSCCIIQDSISSTNCNCDNMGSMADIIVKQSARSLAKTALQIIKERKVILDKKWSCSTTSTNNQTAKEFENRLQQELSQSSRYVMLKDKYDIPYLQPPIEMTVKLENQSATIDAGTWNPEDKFVANKGYQNKEVKRFFRIGIVLGLPWAWINASDHPTDVNYLKDDLPNRGLTGYCVDLLEKLSDKDHMDFDYEIVPATKNLYGSKQGNGSWSGLVGDLISGNIDISVATLTMTTEREEVIDFVAPYFDQSGISILIRKKAPERNMFKFMTVLRPEVWYGILGAVVVVSILIWGLDRFSPYSYYNNKEAYPEGARDFTIGESIWFSLTSLTPQGGGECPKALSGRVLVAAYWLFIVLMLATFTANLAAFLTVERMQTTVQSLEELAKQSKINYSVVADSPYMEYFQNMAGAEEELYKKWKEITLNSSSDQSKYRVWDYPVREQYTHILKVIKESGPLEYPEGGYEAVEASNEGHFAFIHDAAEVRYQYYKNCNFLEVGEPFAEQPLAVAVQQGSHLQKEISKAILSLQKERYFEYLTSKYWSSSQRNNCPVLDDSKGITLNSLGGIFLATLVGLLLSMITLAYEVWQQKKQEQNQVTQISSDNGNGGGEKNKIINVGNKKIMLEEYDSKQHNSENNMGLPTISGFY